MLNDLKRHFLELVNNIAASILNLTLDEFAASFSKEKLQTALFFQTATENTAPIAPFVAPTEEKENLIENPPVKIIPKMKPAAPAVSKSDLSKLKDLQELAAVKPSEPKRVLRSSSITNFHPDLPQTPSQKTRSSKRLGSFVVPNARTDSIIINVGGRTLDLNPNETKPIDGLNHSAKEEALFKIQELKRQLANVEKQLRI